MSDKQSVAVVDEEEMTSLRRSAKALEKEDIVEWLLLQRDHHASISAAEFSKDGGEPDFAIINPAEKLKELYFEAASELIALRDLKEKLTEVLRNRVIVALADAKAPPWVATHRHYKGKRYRFVRIVLCVDHDEPEEYVLYDDEEIAAKGLSPWVLSRRRWESFLDSGKPRYEYIGMTKEEGT